MPIYVAYTTATQSGELMMKQLMTLALVATATLMMPLVASAQFGSIDLEPSKYQRHVACNKAWQASHAYKHHNCKWRAVHWDSYRPGYGIFYMRRSNCWVHVECTHGHPAFPKGVHNGRIAYLDVFRLRRCKDDASKVNTTCVPLTTADVEKGLAAHQESNQLWGAIIAAWLEQNPDYVWE